MKKFISENPTITFGLGLPLLLVVVFLLISGLPALFVAPPQYDVLYATQYPHQQQGLQITVVDQKVQVHYQGNVRNARNPRIWRFTPSTGSVTEVFIVLPPSLTASSSKKSTEEELLKITQVDVPDLEGLLINSSSIAADGYEFMVGASGGSRNILGGLFSSHRYRTKAFLSKSGRSVRLPNSNTNYYRSNTRLIGWVVSQ
jgi:hypothetical protein